MCLKRFVNFRLEWLEITKKTYTHICCENRNQQYFFVLHKWLIVFVCIKSASTQRVIVHGHLRAEQAAVLLLRAEEPLTLGRQNKPLSILRKTKPLPFQGPPKIPEFCLGRDIWRGGKGGVTKSKSGVWGPERRSILQPLRRKLSQRTYKPI